jgi:hypothetical protein
MSMRYNPPPNWPKPPKGWVPHPGWSADPSWPPPPAGWQVWVEDDEPSSGGTKSKLSRLERTGDDVEYFGDDRAWSEDSGRSPAVDQLNAEVSALPSRPTEVAPEDLSVHHLGHYATIRWDEQKYVLGKIVAVFVDSAAISLRLDGVDTPVSFSRDQADDQLAKPTLYVWI